MSRWFRWYEGTSEDGKFRAVARMSRVTVRDVLALWAFMLEDAAHLDHRGVCKRNEDFMASVLDFDDGVVEIILGAMEDNGMISVGAGVVSICNWDKRQFEGDADRSAADRQRRKRERDKGVNNSSVTRDSRPPDTDTDTERKTDSPAPNKARTHVWPHDYREQFWNAYPKRVDKKAAFKVLERVWKNDDVPWDAILKAASSYQTRVSSTDPKYIKSPEVWLNKGCWDDEDQVRLSERAELALLFGGGAPTNRFPEGIV